MNIIEQSYEIITPLKPNDVTAMLMRLEEAGRTCYKSEERIEPGVTADPFIRSIIKRGHESVIEHENLSVRFITDRGVTHELVRHRIASYSQESTRYCDYGGHRVNYIRPSNYDQWSVASRDIWYESMSRLAESYREMRSAGSPPQDARSILPNSLKTEIVTTANLREWRHIFNLRTASGAHPQMIALMQPLKEELIEKIPAIFGDLEI